MATARAVRRRAVRARTKAGPGGRGCGLRRTGHGPGAWAAGRGPEHGCGRGRKREHGWCRTDEHGRGRDHGWCRTDEHGCGRLRSRPTEPRSGGDTHRPGPAGSRLRRPLLRRPLRRHRERGAPALARHMGRPSARSRLCVGAGVHRGPARSRRPPGGRVGRRERVRGPLHALPATAARAVSARTAAHRAAADRAPEPAAAQQPAAGAGTARADHPRAAAAAPDAAASGARTLTRTADSAGARAGRSRDRAGRRTAASRGRSARRSAAGRDRTQPPAVAR